MVRVGKCFRDDLVTSCFWREKGARAPAVDCHNITVQKKVENGRKSNKNSTVSSFVQRKHVRRYKDIYRGKFIYLTYFVV